jgi:hypothetical protein
MSGAWHAQRAWHRFWLVSRFLIERRLSGELHVPPVRNQREGTMTALDVFFLLVTVAPTVPAFVVGRRLGVRRAGVAFIQFVGPTLVILWSIGRSGWMCLIGVVPLASIIFAVWLVLTVPRAHDRTRWWTLPFLIPFVQVAAFYAYAFTLERRHGFGQATLAAS